MTKGVALTTLVAMILIAAICLGATYYDSRLQPLCDTISHMVVPTLLILGSAYFLFRPAN